VLADELGIEPDPAPQQAERVILEQDASLEPPPRATPALASGQTREERLSPISAVRRTRLPVAVGASLALVLTLLFLGDRPQTSPISAAPDTVAVINASRANLTEVVAGIGRPGEIAYGSGGDPGHRHSGRPAPDEFRVRTSNRHPPAVAQACRTPNSGHERAGLLRTDARA
jgi:hypothetical protein